MARKKSDYSDKYLDPRWQRKRLEILKRDEWLCQTCYEGSETLHVHHLFYLSGRDPWEYANELLITLCATCHKQQAENYNTTIEDIFRYGICGIGCDVEIVYMARLMATLQANVGRLDQSNTSNFIRCLAAFIELSDDAIGTQLSQAGRKIIALNQPVA